MKSRAVVRASPIHGRGLFANRIISPGEFIGQYTGPRTDRDTPHTLWVDFGYEQRGYEGTGRLRFVNHSAKPNAEFDDRNLYALQEIQVDEEITFSYGEEWDTVTEPEPSSSTCPGA